MKVLKLCTSDEFAGDLPDSVRAYRVAERVIAEATGEAVESIVKPIWPDPELPDILDRWLTRYEPDVVLLVVSGYWMTFESVPLRMERRLGRLGKRIARIGERAVVNEAIGEKPPTLRVRRLARRIIGADAAFSPKQVNERMEACIRTVLKHEEVGLVVRGPTVALVHNQDERGRLRGERRLLEVDMAMRALSKRLHLEYVGREDADPSGGDESRFLGDFVHTGEEAHRYRGLAEGTALARTWLAQHEGESRQRGTTVALGG